MMRKGKYLCGLLVILTGLFFVQGCSDSTNSGEESGTFTMTITGDENREISGTAVFGGAEDPETGEQGFVLVMTTGDPQNAQASGEAAWLVKLNTQRPGEGSYSVVDSETEENLETGFWGFSIFGQQENQTIYFSKSGSVDINSSSSDNVGGTFNIEMKGFSFSGQQPQEFNITLNGDFDAIGGDNLNIPDYGS